LKRKAGLPMTRLLLIALRSYTDPGQEGGEMRDEGDESAQAIQFTRKFGQMRWGEPNEVDAPDSPFRLLRY
jgi:hypothetical protein